MPCMYCGTDLLLLQINNDTDLCSLSDYSQCDSMSVTNPVAHYNHPNNAPAFDTHRVAVCVSSVPTPGLQLIMSAVCHQDLHPCPLVGLPLYAKLC